MQANSALILPARLDLVPEYADSILSLVGPRARSPEVRIGLVEALTNAIVHGAFQLGPRDSSPCGLFSYLGAVERAQATQEPLLLWVDVSDLPTGARITIADPGDGFDWRSVHRRPGHGLELIFAAFDEVTWNQAGNSVSLELRAPC